MHLYFGLFEPNFLCDGVTGSKYGETLDARIGELIERAKSGSYRAPPVKRVLIPKGDGKERRPIGIPTFEDKLLQRAVEMLLTLVFEQDFFEESYAVVPHVRNLWEPRCGNAPGPPGRRPCGPRPSKVKPPPQKKRVAAPLPSSASPRSHRAIAVSVVNNLMGCEQVAKL